MPLSSKNSGAFSVTSLIVLHLLIVLPLAYTLNIWADEASTLYTTQHGLITAFQNAATDEKQAPLYFWILSLWRSINGSIFFARVFSVICSIFAIKMFAGLAQRVLSPRSALLATAFFAFHPYLIWASLEIRVYSLVILLSIALVRLFLAGFLEESNSKTTMPQGKVRLLFLITAIIALYTNYYLGFLLVSFFFALLISKRWREARVYLGLMLLVATAFLPLLLTDFGAQFTANTGGFQEQRSIGKGLRHLWRHFLTFALPIEVIPDDHFSAADMIRLWAVRIGLIAVGFLSLARRNAISLTTVSLAAVTGAAFACFLVAYFVVGSDYTEIRHASVLFAPVVFFAASLLSDIFVTGERQMRFFNKAAAIAGALLVLASFSLGLITMYPNMSKRGDWARVGAFIAENESPGQPIIVFPTYEVLALPYHYHGVNKILPDERYFELEREAAAGTENSYIKQIDFFISKIPADAEMIWLAVSEKCLVTEACRPLENYVKANYTVEKEQEFYLEKVFLLKKKK